MEIEIVQPIIAMFTSRRHIKRHLEVNTCNFGFGVIEKQEVLLCAATKR